jgi:hypothetical protein
MRARGFIIAAADRDKANESKRLAVAHGGVAIGKAQKSEHRRLQENQWIVEEHARTRNALLQ